MVRELVEYYGEDAVMDMCVEECSELIHALIHYRRAKGNGFEIDKGKATAYMELVHAFADAANAADSLAYILGIDFDCIGKDIAESDKKAMERLKAVLG